MEYKVGDTVTIRQWDDMAEEFGIYGGGIKVEFNFTYAMREFCGNQYKIDYISQRGEFALSNIDGDPLLYTFSLHMFEEPNKSPSIDVSFDEILALF